MTKYLLTDKRNEEIVMKTEKIVVCDLNHIFRRLINMFVSLLGIS